MCLVIRFHFADLAGLPVEDDTLEQLGLVWTHPHAGPNAHAAAARANSAADREAQRGLEFAVFPDDLLAGGGIDRCLTTRLPQRHADLILVETDGNLPGADHQSLGRGVGVEGGFVLADALVLGRAAAGQEECEQNEGGECFHFIIP